MLEQKIADLIEAVEKLTAVMADAQSNQVNVKDTNIETPKRDSSKADVPSAQDLKDATLKAARSGHKDAIRDKLAGFGVTKIQDLDAGNSVAFYGWVTSLSVDQ